MKTIIARHIQRRSKAAVSPSAIAALVLIPLAIIGIFVLLWWLGHRQGDGLKYLRWVGPIAICIWLCVKWFAKFFCCLLTWALAHNTSGPQHSGVRRFQTWYGDEERRSSYEPPGGFDGINYTPTQPEPNS